MPVTSGRLVGGGGGVDILLGVSGVAGCGAFGAKAGVQAGPANFTKLMNYCREAVDTGPFGQGAGGEVGRSGSLTYFTYDAAAGEAVRAELHTKSGEVFPTMLVGRTVRRDDARSGPRLLSFAVSSGARANELLGVTGDRVDWGSQRIWVVSEGTRELSAVPGSPAAFDYLARYFDRCGTPGPAEQIWRTLRGDTRPLTYWAFRRIMQRANEILGTNSTLHDLRHTAAVRMANDPQLTLPEVQTILRHQHLSTTEGYLQPHIEELHDKLREHFTRPRPQVSYAAGYPDEDIEAVFGARN